MKEEGDSSPRVGCRQRSSASTPLDPAVAEVDVGLVGKVHLAVGHGMGKVELEAALLGCHAVLCRLMQHEPAAALDLGAAERGVGLLEHRLGGLAGGGGDDADARLHHDGPAVEHQRLADCLQQVAGERAEVSRLAGGDDDEAVAFEAEQTVAGLEGLLEPGAGYGEERVAGGDAERLVDGAEAVEVEHHQPGGADGATAAHRGFDEALRGGARPDRRLQRRPGQRGAARLVRLARAGEERRGEGGGGGEALGQCRGQAACSAVGDEEEAGGDCVRGEDRGDGGEGSVEPEGLRGNALRGAGTCPVLGQRPVRAARRAEGGQLRIGGHQPEALSAQWRRRPPRLPSAGRLERGRALR